MPAARVSAAGTSDAQQRSWQAKEWARKRFEQAKKAAAIK
jgi:hypothetical protein